MKDYQERIRKLTAKMGYVDKYDPRHIEAYMRLQYGTLAHLSRETFGREIHIAIDCIDVGGEKNAERLAKSYGL